MADAPLYATVDEATPDGGWPDSWTDEDSQASVEVASLYVAHATRFAEYLVNPDTLLPANPALLAVMKRATILTVRSWARAGIEPWREGITPAGQNAGQVTSISGGGRSVSYAQESPQEAASRVSAATTISPAAAMLLASHGLTTRRVVAVRG